MEGQHGYVPPPQTGPQHIPKRLIVCCDGTWQASNHATHEIPSNVAKIARAISKTYINKQNVCCPQVVFYDAGVATADAFDSKLSGEWFQCSGDLMWVFFVCPKAASLCLGGVHSHSQNLYFLL